MLKLDFNIPTEFGWEDDVRAYLDKHWMGIPVAPTTDTCVLAGGAGILSLCLLLESPSTVPNSTWTSVHPPEEAMSQEYRDAVSLTARPPYRRRNVARAHGATTPPTPMRDLALPQALRIRHKPPGVNYTCEERKSRQGVPSRPLHTIPHEPKATPQPRVLLLESPRRLREQICGSVLVAPLITP
ncbi:unnamed protein product [Sphenostylis stenocarpa]|uniref:Uncharacterized protein n=1 Tax=Sphenostylis stenocarpa TaxID=92480 RepID=A0AA86W489_9FABA|nr:unnamed protein product [Sphenostylis stenocarpa]